MLTQNQAKGKWCPFARVVPGVMQHGAMRKPFDVAAHNRVQENGEDEPTWHPAMSCIASECMAWRQEPSETETDNHIELAIGVTPAGFKDYETADADGWRWISIRDCDVDFVRWHTYRDKPSSSRRGYCGLAGQVTP